MSIYTGSDVFYSATHICVVTGDGAVMRRDVVASDPHILANAETALPRSREELQRHPST